MFSFLARLWVYEYVHGNIVRDVYTVSSLSLFIHAWRNNPFSHWYRNLWFDNNTDVPTFWCWNQSDRKEQGESSRERLSGVDLHKEGATGQAEDRGGISSCCTGSSSLSDVSTARTQLPSTFCQQDEQLGASHSRTKYKTSASLFLSFLLHTHKPWPWRSNRWWVKPCRYCLASWRMGKIKRGKQMSVWISLKSLWHIIQHLSPVPLESITVINFSQAYKEHAVYTCYCVIVIVQIVQENCNN